MHGAMRSHGVLYTTGPVVGKTKRNKANFMVIKYRMLCFAMSCSNIFMEYTNNRGRCRMRRVIIIMMMVVEVMMIFFEVGHGGWKQTLC